MMQWIEEGQDCEEWPQVGHLPDHGPDTAHGKPVVRSEDEEVL